MIKTFLHRFSLTACLYLLIAGISACSAVSAPTLPANAPAQTTAIPTIATVAPTTATKVLTIGEISNNPTETLTRFQPLADYLAAQLGAYGYSSAIVKAAPDFETMVAWLKAGEIDMVFDSPYPAMILGDRAGAKPILRRWKGGTEQYHTVIFTRADTKITSLAELKGKTLAFEESFSTSGYMLPKAYLVESGYALVEEKSTDDKVENDQIGYVFTNGDDSVANVIQWVVSGKTAAGAVNNKDFNEIPEETKKLLYILGETEALPRHLALVRSDFDPAVTAALKTAMLGMTTPEAADVLKQFDKTTKFDDFPQGLEQALARMRVLYNLAQGQIG